MKKVSDKWTVHHIHASHGRDADRRWEELLGSECVHQVTTERIPETIVSLTMQVMKSGEQLATDVPDVDTSSEPELTVSDDDNAPERAPEAQESPSGSSQGSSGSTSKAEVETI